MKFSTLDEWLSWQEQLHHQAIDLGLERCLEVATRIQLLDHDYKVISIAGTNGKGSSAAMLDQIYLDAGYSVGTYTSPHILHYNERIRVNGRLATDAEICNAFARIDHARGDTSLTYFEFGTLAAFEIFNCNDIDLVILEVGLGGRLDAVNIVDPDVALITSIDLDHQDWLGNTRDLIGREKAGIMRSRRPAVCSDTRPPAGLLDYAGQIGATLYLAGKDYRYESENGTWSWYSGNAVLQGLPKTGLLRNAQLNNGAGVLKVIELMQESLPVAADVIKASIGTANMPGRFQVYDAKVPVIMDVAHNPAAAELLVRNLEDQSIEGDIHLLIGMLEDKDHLAVLRALSRVTSHWYLVNLTGPRGVTARFLDNILKSTGIHKGVELFDTMSEALVTAGVRAAANDAIVVTGSFITVGAAMQYLEQVHGELN